MRTTKSGRIPGWAALLALLLLVATGARASVPDGVRLPGLRGGEVTSADLARGNWVLVVWASWSPRCRDIVERVNALVDQVGGRARVVALDFQEEPAVVEAFLAGKTLRAPVHLDRDGELSKAMGVVSLPGLLVLRSGEVRYQGRLPADAGTLLDDLLR
jgi:thiol-disulfide isomerase/thioredoxin